MPMSPYLAGLMFGDGTCFRGKNRAYGVWIDQQERNYRIVDEAEIELKRLKLNVHKYRFNDKVRALVYNKELFNEFKVLRGDAASFFESLNNKHKWDFLSGLFDAEGTVTDRLVVYNSDLKLLEVVQKFLLQQGATAYLYRFGKVWGVQVYRKQSVALLYARMNCVKLKKKIVSSG